MRYEVFLVKKVDLGRTFEEAEQIVGTVVATDAEEAKQVAKETFKELHRQPFHVREQKPRKGVWT